MCFIWYVPISFILFFLSRYKKAVILDNFIVFEPLGYKLGLFKQKKILFSSIISINGISGYLLGNAFSIEYIDSAKDKVRFYFNYSHLNSNMDFAQEFLKKLPKKSRSKIFGFDILQQNRN